MKTRLSPLPSFSKKKKKCIFLTKTKRKGFHVLFFLVFFVQGVSVTMQNRSWVPALT